MADFTNSTRSVLLLPGLLTFLTNICTLHLVNFLLEGLSLVHAHQPNELLFEKSYVEKEDVGLVFVEGGIYSEPCSVPSQQTLFPAVF